MEKIIISIVAAVLIGLGTWNLNQTFNLSIYPTAQECNQAHDKYMNAYDSKPQNFKDKMVTEAFCIPFESFPIEKFKKDIGA